MTTHYIYVLRDPRNNAIRYVGYTNDPMRRRGEHIAEGGKKGKNYHKANWIRLLYGQGLKPIFQTIFQWEAEQVSQKAWEIIERNWVRELRAIGHDLTNILDGGGGFTSDDVRRHAERLGPEGCRARSRKAMETLGVEGRRNRAIKANASQSAEERKARTAKALETLGKEGRRARALKSNAALGVEGRRAKAVKITDTKREKNGGTKGVSFNRSSETWLAYLDDASGKRTYLGSYATREQAEKVVSDGEKNEITSIKRPNSGVTIDRSKNNFIARLKTEGKIKILGRFDTRELAEQAVRDARNKLQVPQSDTTN